ncbi:hypothetical protein I2494_00435 [Budviciaceae bacterium BWR-B9]|uniref:DUF4123 domain-containing protein n=1 Tax=Limnobaculum allomyrinae TaxID=2791986 RepID=A0ABS1IKD9_9GAMM|nr:MULTISPECIES: hypothetical protein [Limnobaculum]MBK5142198.1 hypothetical protein [Limnobaculum allomyrinae]MBV7690918.1 hypothetical protein [Limnobaculum sp. M2-1]
MEKQLISILNNDKAMYRYLLLDGLASVSELDLVNLNNLKNILGNDAITVVERPDLTHELFSCPQLVVLARPNDDIDSRITKFSLIQANSERLFSKRYVCGWMTSELPPEIVAKHIVRIAQSISEMCSMRFTAFYEPLRMQLLHDGNKICDEWLAATLNIFNSYCYLSVNSTLRHITRLKRLPEPIDIFISEDAKFYQQESKALFHLYNGWVECSASPLDDFALLRVARLYREAWEQRLTNMEDKYIFSLLSLKYGDLMKNPLMAQAVNEARIAPGSLPARMKAIEQRHFMALK